MQKDTVPLMATLSQLPMRDQPNLGSTTPTTPTTPFNAIKQVLETASPSCWHAAKVLFSEEIMRENMKPEQEDSKKASKEGGHSKKDAKKTKSEEDLARLRKDINIFLEQKKSITSVIKSAETLTHNVEKRYPETLTKCLHIMERTREVGDKVLSSAPDIAAAVWWGISLFLDAIQVDVKRCNWISDMCYQLSKMVLNCRLFEHKCRDPSLHAEREAKDATLDSITGVLSEILRFIWFADRKFQQIQVEEKSKAKSLSEKAKAMANIIKVNVKNIFDDHTSDNYERLVTKYNALLEIQNMSFYDMVLTCLRETTSDTTKTAEYIEKILCPSVQETLEVSNSIKIGLTSLREELQEGIAEVKGVADEIKTSMGEAEWRREITEYYETGLRSRQTEAYARLLETTLEPLRRSDIHESEFGNWLFRDPVYQAWKHKISNQDSITVEAASAPYELPPQEVPPPIIYLTGKAGFGKSVIMALAIEKLQRAELTSICGSHIVDQRSSLKNKQGKECSNPVILFFFFKKGDNSTQTATAAARSLLAQVFKPDHRETPVLNSMWEAVNELKIKRGENDDATPGQSDGIFSNLIGQLETAIKAIGRKVYLIVDGLDECVDCGEHNIVSQLARLAKSNPDIFRILISSRKDKNIKKELIAGMLTVSPPGLSPPDQHSERREQPEDGNFKGYGRGPAIHGHEESDSKQQEKMHITARDNSKLYECYDGVTILNIKKDTNSEDMLSFLDISLRGLMQRGRLKEYFVRKDNKYSLQIKPEFTQFEAIIRKMAEHIQRNSRGMFTYSAMTITSLRQPSELSLSQRIRGLPTGMNQIYSSHLKSLTDAERKLVILALTRIYWSNVCGVQMHTLEIVEQFKKYYELDKNIRDNKQEDGVYEDDFGYDYLMNNTPNQRAGTADMSAIDIENGVLDERPPGDIGTQKSVPGVHDHGGPSSLRNRSSSFHHGHQMANQMNNPEVAEVIYHLNTAGRDFFKFSNEDRNIEFIHTSVREWMDKQTSKTEKASSQHIHKAPLVSTQNDELIFTLTVSRAELVNIGSSTFERARHAHLAVLKYILQVLTHPKFQNAYMPLFPLPPKITKMFSEEGQNKDELKDSDGAKEKEPVAKLTPSDNNSATQGQTQENKDRKAPWRGEIHHWIHHMRRLAGLWPPDTRTSQDWELVLELLGRFTGLNTFWRWNVQFRQFNEDISLEKAKSEWSFWGPIHLSVYLEVEIYNHFLQDRREHAECFYRELGVVDPLQYEDVFYCPEYVRSLVNEGSVVSSARQNDELTPFLICLSLAHQETRSNRNSSTFKKVVESLKIIANSRKDLGLRKLFPQEPQLPMHRIAQIWDEELFEMVLGNSYFHLEQRDDCQRTILHTIFSSGKAFSLPAEVQINFGRRLLEAGANPNAEDMRSRMPLYKAVYARNVEAVNLILDFKYPDGISVKVNDTDDNGDTALSMLVSSGLRDEMVEEGLSILDALDRNGASLDAPENSHMSPPWMRALYLENWEFATRLLDMHAEKTPDNRDYLMMVNNDGENALEMAIEDSAGLEMMKRVLGRPELTEEEKKSLIEAVNGNREPLIIQGVKSGEYECVQYLLECGANDQVRSKDGRMFWELLSGKLFSKRKLLSERGSERYSRSDFKRLVDKLLTPSISQLEFSALFPYLIRHAPPDRIHYIFNGRAELINEVSSNWDYIDQAFSFGRHELICEISNHQFEYNVHVQTYTQKLENSPQGWNRDRKHPEIQLSEDGLAAIYECKSESRDRLSTEEVVALSAQNPTSPYVDLFYYEISIIKFSGNDEAKFGVGFVSGPPPSNKMPGSPFRGIYCGGTGYGLHSQTGRLYSFNTSSFMEFEEESYEGEGEGMEAEYDEDCEYDYGSEFKDYEDYAEDYDEYFELDGEVKRYPRGRVRFQVGDIIGCGYDQKKHLIFWTRNGKFLGVGFKGVGGQFFPAIGASASASFEVKANFGAEPWAWDKSLEIDEEMFEEDDYMRNLNGDLRGNTSSSSSISESDNTLDGGHGDVNDEGEGGGATLPAC
ncbi:hypothetical protein TWF730_006563 [Orbilia blumenaviensis]|uniref:B30.2/SPRY domain-containing protein n=1 Tax=Orbilia blumenaviensis TaxID=1796055 RepID=A0AAV9VEL1_9PEZI